MNLGLRVRGLGFTAGFRGLGMGFRDTTRNGGELNGKIKKSELETGVTYVPAVRFTGPPNRSC